MNKIYNGSQILIKAALDAGCEYFAGYPITPAAKILENFSKEADNNKNLNFLQVEDEIAAVHSIIGASLAGKKALTATSGPGFSLMQEGIGLSFAASIPIVIANVMRQGPSTGMPTKPSQGDILQTQYGTHGDYQAIVFYPNSLSDIYHLTITAFNTAVEVNSPVVLLLDAVLVNLYETVILPTDRLKTTKHNLEFGRSNRHFSGLVTDNEGSPQTDNYKVYKNWIEERFETILNVSKNLDISDYTYQKSSKNLVIAYGSVSRLLPESQDFDVFIPKMMFPIDKKLKTISKKYEKVLTVEMNEGQYTHALESFLDREVDLVKLYGNDLFPERIVKLINEKI